MNAANRRSRPGPGERVRMPRRIRPVRPMEPRRVDEVPTGEEYVYQVKWDGVRLLFHRHESGIDLFTRSLRSCGARYPELTSPGLAGTGSQILLDGEAVVVGRQGPDFERILQRQQSGLRNAERLSRLHPVTYVAFDVLYADGGWLLDLSWERRSALLDRFLPQMDSVVQIASYDNGSRLFETIRRRRWEGIVAKEKKSTYRPGKKSGRWLKVKVRRALTAVVGGCRLGSGAELKSLLIGLPCDRDPVFLGAVGSGLSRRARHLLKEFCLRNRRKSAPFRDRPDESGEVVWVEPELAVRVEYGSVTSKGRLREPVITGFAGQSPGECGFDPL